MYLEIMQDKKFKCKTLFLQFSTSNLVFLNDPILAPFYGKFDISLAWFLSLHTMRFSKHKILKQFFIQLQEARSLLMLKLFATYFCIKLFNITNFAS